LGRTTKSFKCASCGAEISVIEEDASTKPYMVAGKKYCQHCGEIKSLETKQLVELRDYINDSPYLANGDKDCWPYLTRQIKQLVEEDGFKYTGILLTLKYIYEDKENGIKRLPEFSPEIGITWMVEKYYPIARKKEEERRAIKLKRQEKFTEEMIQAQNNLPLQIIYIDKEAVAEEDRRVRERRKDRRFGPMIDINEIEDWEDN